MEKIKEKLDVDEYSASQTTLEQIFNGFARLEEEVVQRKFTKENMQGEESKDDHNRNNHGIFLSYLESI